LRIKAS